MSLRSVVVVLFSAVMAGICAGVTCPPGDINGDCQVELGDLATLAQQWLQSDCLGEECVNLDGTAGINLLDFGVIADHWLEAGEVLVISELMASNATGLLDADNDRPDWFELHNISGKPLGLLGWYVTDDPAVPNKWALPDISLPADGYKYIFASGKDRYATAEAPNDNHANFSLAGEGEYLAVVRPNLTIAYKYAPQFPAQMADVSYGLDAAGNLQFMTTPTPGAANVTGAQGLVAEVKFSVGHGFFSTPQSVTLTCATPEAQIRYTTNGTPPTAVTGTVYSGPIAVNRTTVVRAAAYKTGWISPKVRTNTYIFLDDIVNSGNPYYYAEASHPTGWPDTSLNGQAVDYGLDNTLLGLTDTDFGGQTYRQLLDDALLSIPTLCISIDANQFFYTQSTHQPCALELINPDGSAGFEINAGMRIRGGVSAGGGNPKHGWRIFFSDQFEGPLHFPLFGSEGADKFSKVDLRCDQNRSWSFGGDTNAIFINDIFARSLQRELGGAYNRGRFYHLYIDGLYWGLYGTEERADNDYGASYFGGDSSDYDALKSSGGVMIANEGSLNAYNRLWTEATAGFGGAPGSENYERFYQVQGLTTDGYPNPYAERLLDVDNVIAFMIDTYYMYNFDGPISANWTNLNNVFVIYNRVNPDGFKYFVHDAENCFSVGQWASDLTSPTTVGTESRHFNAKWLHQQLTAHPEYRMCFADKVQQHYFNNGILTPAKAQELFLSLRDQINLAVIGESARWGDLKTTPGRSRRPDWVTAINAQVSQWFPKRSGENIKQYRARGWFPSIDAPALSQFGGQVAPGYNLVLAAAAGDIYYTIDGSDPRLQGGDLNPTAIKNTINPPVPSTVVTLMAESAAKKAFVPTADIGTNWRTQYIYSETGWLSGTGAPGGVGYENSSGYQSYITIDVKAQMLSKNQTCYIRIPFLVDPAQRSQFNKLTLRMRYDDGYIAYLNGSEVARKNFTGTPVWNSGASAGHDDSAAVVFEDVDITASLGSLVDGGNLLAIQGLNSGAGSTDFLISGELKAEYGGSNGGGTPIPLNHTTQIKTRAKTSTEWSALNDATFAVGSARDYLRISEIMFNPANDPNAEFIELKNIGTQSLCLNKVSFNEGIKFTFPDVELAAGQYVVLARNLAAFSAQYGTEINVAGVYEGNLDKAGERLKLVDALGLTIEEFTYSDGWYQITDGDGFSLTRIDPAAGDPSVKATWRPSSLPGGSPGSADTGSLPAPGAVVINEVLAHAHAGQPDWIELYNTTTQPVNIGGWFLSDSDADDAAIKKYRIADGTSVPALGYLVFYQHLSFGNTGDPGCRVAFALSENGEKVVLNSASGETLTGYRVTEDFGASESGVTLGRYLTSTGSTNFVALSSPTPNAANVYPLVGPIVISELNYNPPANGSEYVELKNISAAPVTLEFYDSGLGVTVPWQFTDGIDFVFPLGTTIPAGGVLVLANAAPASFRAAYPSVPAGVTVLGPFANSTNLSNSGERVQIGKPGDVDSLGVRQYIRVDRVTYSDGTHPDTVGTTDPWPTSPDGSGPSLQRKVLANYGNDLANWQAGAANPGL